MRSASQYARTSRLFSRELNDRLLISHLTFVTISVAEHVQTDHLIVRLHRLFVTFQRTIASDAVAFQIRERVITARAPFPISSAW